MVQNIYCLPDYFRPHCFPNTSTKLSVCILLHSGMTVKPPGRVSSLSSSLFSHSSSSHSPKISQSVFSETDISANPDLSVLDFGYQELITLESLVMSIMQEFSSRRLGDKVHFSMVPFHWLTPSFYSCRLLLCSPHASQKLQHGNRGSYRKQCNLMLDYLFHLQPSDTAQQPKPRS